MEISWLELGQLLTPWCAMLLAAITNCAVVLYGVLLVKRLIGAANG